MGSSQSTSLSLTEGVQLESPTYLYYTYCNERDNAGYYRGVVKRLLTSNRKRYEQNHNRILDEVRRRTAEVGLRGLQFSPSC